MSECRRTCSWPHEAELIGIERYDNAITRSLDQFDRVPRTSREFALALLPRGAYIIFLDENMKFGGLSEFME